MHEHNITDSPPTLLPLILGLLISGFPVAYYCYLDYRSKRIKPVEKEITVSVDDTILFDCGDLNLTYKI